MPLLFYNVEKQYQKLRHPGRQCTDGCAHNTQPWCAKMSVNQRIIDTTVHRQRPHGQPQRNAHCPCAPQSRQQDLRHRKKYIGIPDHRQIGDTLFDDLRLRRKGCHQRIRPQTYGQKKPCRHSQRKMQSYGRSPLHRSLLPLSEILGTQNHHRFSDSQQDLLVHKLNLVDRRHAGQCRFTVCPQHDIIRQVHA